MAKKVKTTLKLQLPAGAATPAPPVGPALGQHGINIGEFVKRFNDETREKTGDIIPVVITVFEDRSFELKYKTPPASDMLRKAAGIEKGSATAGKKKTGKVTKADLVRIAEKKMEDLNTTDVEQAAKIIAGTARSMGLEVVE
ncbi:MAG: 50S ribosomal protein L11 [Parcubacteria group bacterium]|nr:50S ribosomal protein L11 [Parcubacteria group bacterium]